MPKDQSPANSLVLTMQQDMLRLGISPTRSRLAILEAVYESNDHPDADTILVRAMEKDKTVSLATVYRNLKSFHEAGIIQKLDFGDGRARYEIEPRTHHDHFIDIESGAVIEFHDDELEKLQIIIAERLGFELTGHRMELYGKRRRTTS